MKAIYKQVTKNNYVRAVSALADVIWRECFRRDVPPGKMDTLLDQLQSPDVIDEAIHEQDMNYFLVQLGGKDVGYFAFRVTPGALELNKIFLLQPNRGRGLGREIVAYCEALAVGDARARMVLRVPQKCVASIAFFKHRGFQASQAVETPMHGGWILTECEMEKSVRF